MRIGDVVTQVNHPRRVWQVVRVVTPLESIPHASLECVSDRKTTKFLSCRILQDRRSYIPVVAENWTQAAE